jgi:hypothetical protein
MVAKPSVDINNTVGLCQANSCLVDDSVKSSTKFCTGPPLSMLRMSYVDSAFAINRFVG